MADTFGALQGARLGGEAGFSLKIQVNTGDLYALDRKMRGLPTTISKGLWSRGRQMGATAVKQLNAAAPEGQGGGWIRGSPPLRGSHQFAMNNAYYATVYTTAPHARFIVNGFTPHMPPAHAWIGQQELSFVMRRAVLNNETPEAPRDYFTPVAESMEATNALHLQLLEAKVKAQLDS